MITNKSKFFTHQVKNFFNINVKKKVIKTRKYFRWFLGFIITYTKPNLCVKFSLKVSRCNDLNKKRTMHRCIHRIFFLI